MSAVQDFAYANPMQAPRLEKVIINIGVGEAGEKLIKAEKVLSQLTKRKPVRTLSRVANRDWNLRVGLPIGCKVTLRGAAAKDFLKTCLEVRNNKLDPWNFDQEGNLNFGFSDHTDFPGMKYDPDIGIFGLNVTATLSRPGYRVKRRRVLPSRIPRASRIVREEGIAWVKANFPVEVLEE